MDEEERFDPDLLDDEEPFEVGDQLAHPWRRRDRVTQHDAGRSVCYEVTGRLADDYRSDLRGR